MKTILLKFSGPLQSWGTNSHFETRKTDLYPSKSAIIGLIAASLGYKRDETDKIKTLNSLDFAVRVDQVGNIIKDYHIARAVKNNKELYTEDSIDRTYVTNRYYLSDYIFTVALSHEDNNFIDNILTALKNPYFQPYMGRKSLPVNNDFIIGETSKNAIDSIIDLEWQAAEYYKKIKIKNLYNNKNSIKLEVICDKHLHQSLISTSRKDNVESFSRKNRSFGFRYETRFLIDMPLEKNDTTEHNIFDLLGG